MERQWSIKEDKESYTFQQGDKQLTINKSRVPSYVLEAIESDHRCEHCKQLPVRGYFRRHNWCVLSRGIANFHEEGLRWE